ncbi:MULTISPECIES: hypothetical protein [Acinetobacter calcoaceticus/baumannii complex]|uniref:hypothetical protein n=1 Tax=Acinetobacter calcoaceticus/baumannii complex TaxID=909768 RepID=UPI0011BB45C6|nr:hypothetical protein [Acinetobacter pittii]QEA26351.1 hypothetical protein FR838_18355 [Acinetobacter pittii]
MLFGVPYDQAADMPLDLAVALLNDERLDNTHQRPPKSNSPQPPTPPAPASKDEGTTFVAMGRKHSKPKG